MPRTSVYGEEGASLRVGANEEAGNVVVAAGLVGGGDKARAELLKGKIEAQQRLEVRIGELARQAVGAKQEEVSRLSFQLEDIGRDGVLRAQSAGNDVAQRGAQGFHTVHAAHADLLFDQRVVDGDLLEARVAKAVTAAVADVEDPCVALVDEQSHQGSAHAAEVLASLGAGEDGLIGSVDGQLGIIGQRIFRGAAGEQPHHFVDGKRTGDLAGCGAAHAIANNIHSVFDGKPECVFVGGAFAAAVRNCRSRI